MLLSNPRFIKTLPTYIRFLFKGLLWLFSGIIILLVALLILLQTCWLQNLVVTKTTSWLSKKLNTTVRLDEINITFPKSIYLKNLFVTDLHADTLVFFHELKADIGMMSLFKKQLIINAFSLDGASIFLNRTVEDNAFNFAFIQQAFSPSVPENQKADTSSSSFGLSIGKITLHNVRFSLNDEVGGLQTNLLIGDLAVGFKSFDLSRNIILADALKWSNSSFYYNQSKPLQQSTSAASSLPVMQLGAGHIHIQNVGVDYADTTTQLKLNGQIGLLDFTPDTIDINRMIFTFQNIVAENSTLEVATGSSQTAGATAVETAAASPAPVLIRCGSLSLSAIDFKYDDNSAAPSAPGLDYSHLAVTGINGKANNLFYNGLDISADIAHLQGSEKCGLNIKEASGLFRMTPAGVKFDSCLLITEKSTIRKGFDLQYASLEALQNDLGKMQVKAHLQQATIAMSDVLFFYPPLAENENIKPILNRTFVVDGMISGSLENLFLNNLKVRSGATQLQANLNIKGLPAVDQMAVTLRLSQFASSREELLALLPDSLIPASVTIPETFSVNGNFDGTKQNFNSAFFLQSSLGNVLVSARLSPVTATEQSRYHAKIDLEDFDVGKLLQQEETVGKADLTATIEGEGTTPVTMNASINMQVKKMELLGYQYHQVQIDGQIAGQAFKGNIEMNQEDVALKFDGLASLDPEHPDFNFSLDVEHADLYALHLFNSPLKFTGNINGKFTGNDLDNLNGKITMTKAAIATEKEVVYLDSTSLTATSLEGKYDWMLKTPVVDATYSGTSSAAIGLPLLINHFNYYFNRQAYKYADTLGQQSFQFAMQIHDEQTLLPVFIKGLDRVTPFSIEGTFNSATRTLNISSTPADITYRGIEINDFKMDAASGADQFTYEIAASKISKDTLAVMGVSAKGFARNDSVNILFTIRPDSGNLNLLIGGSVASVDNQYRLHLFPDQLIFKNQQWQVPHDNFLQFGSKGLWANNMKLSNPSGYLLLQSETAAPAAPLNLTFHNFDLGIISRIVDTSTEVIKGVMNGQFQLTDSRQYTFTAGLSIANFGLFSHEIGNVTLDADNDSSGKYNVKLQVQGTSNNLLLNGYYTRNDTGNPLHFNMQIDKADFSLAESFAKPYILQPEGSIQGRLLITGSSKAPTVNGFLQFDSSSFVASYTNTRLKIGNQPITFDDAGIHFMQLKMLDSSGQQATINGDLFTKDYRSYNFALDIKATDFELMHSDARASTDYYGTLRLNFNLKLRGNETQPEIGLTAKLLEGTNITYIYNRSDTSFNTEEGMVEFIDVRHPQDSLFRISGDTSRNILQAYRITASLEVDEKSQFNIIVDPLSGDRLQLNGNGSFVYDENPNGKRTLTGRYEIAGGSYNLVLYNVVKRQFILDKGSAITWTGDILDADIDAKGHLDVRTSPYALIGAQSASVNEAQQAQYKNPLDFEVYLIMRNKLLSPDITFDIQLAEKEKGALDGIVDAKLAELQKSEGEMNKQVFALMVLGSFVATDPLASTGASGYLNDVAKSSASNILSSQLNKLSGQYIKGVELNFDLKSVSSYENGVQEDKTQLNVGIREQLFNDRLLIYVGTNFDIGGTNTFSAKPSDLSGDFSLEYLVKEDGRLRLNLFRKNSYEGIFEGQTVENGLSVIYNRDFNSFRQIFIKGKEAVAENRRKRKAE